MAQLLFDEAFLRQLDQLTLLSRQVRRGQMQGERRSPKRGQSVEFADYRDYVPGDDLRAVDWNVYARLERLFVKLFVEEEDAHVHVLYAVRLAGALGYIALAGMDRVSALALGNGSSRRMPPVRGKRQALDWFGWLEAHRPHGAAHLGPALGQYAATARPAGPALLISDLFDGTWQDGLSALAAARFEVTVLQVLAPQEVNPDLEGDLKLVDSETGQAVEITADYDLLARYRAGLAEWQEQVRSFCARRGINYVLIETSQPVEALLTSFLRERAVIK